MEEMLRQHLAACAAAFGDATGTSKPALGLKILRDNTFFRRAVDESQGFTVRTYDRVMQWFADNWPPETAWPPEVPRPGSSDPLPAEPDPAPKSPSPTAVEAA